MENVSSKAAKLGGCRMAIAAAGSAVAATMFGSATAHAAWSVYDQDIPQLETALSTGQTTDVSVVQQYLARIATYNKAGGGDGTLGNGGTGLNAVAQVNPSALADAAAVDNLIKSGATTAQYPLLGVPVLVKNSYDVAGLITTNGVSIFNGSTGTAGSTTLVAASDSPSIAALKAEGAIIIGKASMSTMAYSYDGIDNSAGVVENAYNPVRQPGGSSSGIGVGVSAQLAMLGMGGETGGSIRVPSTYNADVGLKTSAGLINPEGTFPLTPSRDVVGPIAKDVTDIAYAMNALVQTPAALAATASAGVDRGTLNTSPNLFAGTPYYPTTGAQPGSVGTGLGEGTDPTSKGLTAVTGTRPVDYTSFLSKTPVSSTALAGKTFFVENDIIPASAGTTTGAYDGTINNNVYANFQRAISVLQSEGATIKYGDLPATVTYYNSIGKTSGATTTGFNDASGNPIPYPTTTVGGTTPSSTWSNYAAAYYYEKQIEGENNPTIKNLNDFAAALLAGKNASSGSKYSTLSSAYSNIASLAAIYNAGNAAGFGDANGDGVLDNPDAQTALQAFTTLREQEFDDFLTANNIDAVIAPTMGSVAPLVTSALRPGVSSTDPIGGGTASLVGRFEGNILGLPSLAVPDGFVADPDSGLAQGTPTSIQFMGRLDGEGTLIGDGYDYEQASLALGEGRVDPNLAFVPEPGSIMVILAGGTVFLGRRRNRTA
jgi:amidase